MEIKTGTEGATGKSISANFTPVFTTQELRDIAKDIERLLYYANGFTSLAPKLNAGVLTNITKMIKMWLGLTAEVLLLKGNAPMVAKVSKDTVSAIAKAKKALKKKPVKVITVQAEAPVISQEAFVAAASTVGYPAFGGYAGKEAGKEFSDADPF